MPKTKGIEVLRWVRGSEVYRNVPFMMLTAEADVALVKEAIEADVDSYIVKPWSAESFERGLKTALKNRAEKIEAGKVNIVYRDS